MIVIEAKKESWSKDIIDAEVTYSHFASDNDSTSIQIEWNEIRAARP
jgi:hypothetical protein